MATGRLVWNPQTGGYVRVVDEAEQKRRDAVSARMQAQADMILEKRRQDDIVKNRASQSVETKKQAEARVNTPNLVADFKVEDAKRRQAAAAKAEKERQERIWGYQGGMQAARGIRQQAGAYETEAMRKIAEAYDPMAGDIESNRAAELQRLSDAIAAAQGQVGGATTEALGAIPQTATAFQGLPLLELQQEQNPLLAALQSQGAGTQEVESQRALDAALAQQLSALSKRSAGQLQAGEQSYLDALRRSATMAGAAGQQYLATQRPALESAIGQRFAEQAAEQARQRRAEESDVTQAVQNLLTTAIETEGETKQKYGPGPKKPGAKKPAGKKKQA